MFHADAPVCNTFALPFRFFVRNYATARAGDGGEETTFPASRLEAPEDGPLVFATAKFMTRTPESHTENSRPTLGRALLFRLKAALFQTRRGALNLLVYRHRRFGCGASPAGQELLALSRTRLWTETDEAERFLLAGKVHNLRLALRRLNGVEVPAGAVFSFWAHVGRTSRRRGFVYGRELREGCLIPSVGGGLCQLSNALYEAALQANFEIIERHAHTRAVPGSQAATGRDATVFWNYVDLRWRAPQAFRIEAFMDGDYLTVSFRAAHPAQTGSASNRPPQLSDERLPAPQQLTPQQPASQQSTRQQPTPHQPTLQQPTHQQSTQQQITPQQPTQQQARHQPPTPVVLTRLTSSSFGRSLPTSHVESSPSVSLHASAALPSSVALPQTSAARLKPSTEDAPNSCVSCGVLECFRHVAPPESSARFGRAAFIVDDYWPEFDLYVQGERDARDMLCLPLDGKRFGRAAYAWNAEGFGEVRERRWLTLLRAYESRRLSEQGAARQRALLRNAARLAEAHAARLDHTVTHVVVTQSLLPFLWRGGHLGGRTFDVLMTALPLARLHERLDEAARLHPESPTLADFRADDALVNAETEALRAARRIVTPHARIAALFPEKSVSLKWFVPRASRPAQRGEKIVFPAATLGRKGAYELREAIARLRLPLVTLGAPHEADDFWRGLDVEQRRGDFDWLEGARAVVLPAFVEHRPRRLLEAVSRGVPVVASHDCGLGEMKGVVTVRAGDAEALRAALESLMSATDEAGE